MTVYDIHEALWKITAAEYEQCKDRLNILSKESKTERKAIQIELGMYNVCLRAGLLSEDHKRVLAVRGSFVKRFLKDFPAVADAFQNASKEEQEAITVALGGDMFMRTQFLVPYQNEMNQARGVQDVSKIFEINIKLGAIEKVLHKWEKWRIEHGVYPNMLEVISHE